MTTDQAGLIFRLCRSIQSDIEPSRLRAFAKLLQILGGKLAAASVKAIASPPT